MTKTPHTRKAISKTLRFEVFKRDSFKCQYCGAAAPQVLLHVDHIVAVAKGGSNELMNLITSCDSCNLGKRDKPLSDDSAIRKSRNQLEDLQARREQLEMMMEWKEGLRDLHAEAAARACAYWESYTPGWSISESGRANVAKWIKTFSADEVISAMDKAATYYLKTDHDGKITPESWEIAFSKISGICRVERASQDEPDLKQLYYVRGIARNNCPNYFVPYEALEALRAARSWDIPMEQLARIARDCWSYTNFLDRIDEAIDEKKNSEKAG